jgi:YfiH family protein
LLLDNTNGLLTYRFESLAVEGLVHAVFTRCGGVSQGPFATLNVGRTVGDEPSAIAENHNRIYAHLDLEAQQVATPSQVHGNRVVVVKAEGAPQVIPNTDGLITADPGAALLLRFADCQPILLYDPVHRVVGLVHAGWRGVAQAIARRAVERMQEAFGSDPATLLVGLGPAIGPCCYEVGDKVASALSYALSDWHQVLTQDRDSWRLDLPGANAQQLSDAGVRHIEQSHLCTACQTDHFYSHRAEKGRTGRFAVVTYLQDGSTTDPKITGSGPGSESAAHDSDKERPVGTPSAGEADGQGPPRPSLHPPGLPAFQGHLGDIA